MDAIIKKKVEDIVKRYSLKNTKYFEEALFVVEYGKKSQAGTSNIQKVIIDDGPNRKLANVGDRVIKLVLTEHKYRSKSASVEAINIFTNDNEKNENIANLGILTEKDGYSITEGLVEENQQTKAVAIATLVEAVIGAIYLEEMETSGTFNEARSFIETQLIAKAKDELITI